MAFRTRIPKMLTFPFRLPLKAMPMRAPPLQGEPHHTNPAVIVVDDDPMMRLFLRSAFEQMDYVVHEAGDGIEALQRFDEIRPDLVVMDVRMPRMDGLMACANIRNSKHGGDVPIILITGINDTEAIESAFKAGATNFVLKPINWTIFKHHIHFIMRAYRTFAEQKRVEKSLRDSEERLRFTLSSAHAGVWDLNLETRLSIWSEEMYDIYGVAPDHKPITQDEWLDHLHPEDRPRIARRGREVLAAKVSEFDNEYRIVHPERGVRWIIERGRIQFDARGYPLRVGGINLDITDRKRAELALKEEAIRRRILVEQSTYGIVVLDQNGKVYEANPRFAEMIGYSPEEVLELHVWDWDPEWTPGKLAEQMRLADTGGTQFETRHRRRDGLFFDVETSIHAAECGGQMLVFCVCQDISRRKAAEAELWRADRRKDEFLAMLAHELRNPLAPIRSAAAVLHKLGKDHRQLQWAGEVIDRQVTHLARLVDDLLDVSRLMRGKIHLQPQDVEIALLLEHALEVSRPYIETQRHELLVTQPREPLWIYGDPVRLVQVVQNLLNNAAKYTPPGGRIRLDVAAENGQLVIRVRDSGIGISSQLLPHIFELFTQGEQGLDRSQGGLGIGLTIVKKLVELHGGQVEAASEGIDRGSEFTVRLPLCEHCGPADREAVRPDLPPIADGLRILVVDDNRDAAESLGLLLSAEGHTVQMAFDGLMALELAASFEPEVVLLDIGLPGLDGYAVAQRLREQPETRAALIIAITGYGQGEDRARAIALGFDHYLIKPVDLTQINELLVRTVPCQPL
jgi:PAS domain S-box-containing protein